MKTINRPEVKTTMRLMWASDMILEVKKIIKSDISSRKKVAAIKKLVKLFE